MQATKSQQTIRRDSGRRKGDFTSSTDGRMELAAELLDRIYDPIRDEMHQVDQNLKDLGRDQPPFLSQILDHVMDNTGKRLRPALALLASRFHPYDGHAVETMASAVELLHVAALVHDDFLDNSNIRRGRATIGSLWGRNAAGARGRFRSCYRGQTGLRHRRHQGDAAVRAGHRAVIQRRVARDGRSLQLEAEQGRLPSAYP